MNLGQLVSGLLMLTGGPSLILTCDNLKSSELDLHPDSRIESGLVSLRMETPDAQSKKKKKKKFKHKRG